MSMVALPKLTSLGLELDLQGSAFGELRRSDDVAHNSAALRERVSEDGYLYMPGLLDRDQVLAARQLVVDRLAELGHLDENHPRLAAVSKPGGQSFMPKPLTHGNRALHAVLYEA